SLARALVSLDVWVRDASGLRKRVGRRTAAAVTRSRRTADTFPTVATSARTPRRGRRASHEGKPVRAQTAATIGTRATPTTRETGRSWRGSEPRGRGTCSASAFAVE